MPASEQSPGLRERKRVKTFAAIQSHALRLFSENGYDATTIQQIIDAAEVSESTFFRYFPTKEDVVVLDDLDPIFDLAVRSQPIGLSPIDAIRGAFRDAFSEISEDEWKQQRERIALVVSVPALRARMLDQFFGGTTLLAEALAARSGRTADDIELRTLAGAVIGGTMAILFDFAGGSEGNIAQLMDGVLERLQKGFTL